jgi:hypothetical protein
MLNDPKSGEHRGVTLNTHDFVKHERDIYWYVGVGMLLLLTFCVMIYIKEYLLALVVIGVALAGWRLIHAEPTKHEVKITKTGVYWGNQFFAYHQLHCFWFNSVEGNTTFHVERLNFNPEISFIVPDASSEAVFDHLLTALPWRHDTSEGVSDKLGRWFKI